MAASDVRTLRQLFKLSMQERRAFFPIIFVGRRGERGAPSAQGPASSAVKEETMEVEEDTANPGVAPATPTTARQCG